MYENDGHQPARAYDLDEITIRGLWFWPTLRESHSAVTVISRQELDLSPSASLSGVVSSVSGIHIKDYGGSSGLKTITQRGLGAEHTLILVNGMRVSSFQNGLIDFGLFPTDNLERVEVLHGGYSASYGSDAVGGVINLVTSPPEDQTTGTVEGSVGSFGYQKVGAGAGTGWQGGGLRASVAGERSRGDYPFLFSNGPKEYRLTRSNADVSSDYATLGGFLSVGEGSRLSLFSSAFQSERGVPGPVLGPSSSSVARQSDEDYLLQLSLSREGASSRFTSGIQVHSAYQRYQDPALRIASSSGLDTYFKNNDYRLSVSYSEDLWQSVAVSVGGEAAATRADGLSLGRSLTRWNGAAYVSASYRRRFTSPVIREVVFRPTVRFDSFTGVSPAVSPQIGMVARFQEARLLGVAYGFHLHLSFNRNFRVPTFNEMYYRGGGGIGNPQLRPERSSGYEAGGGVTFRLAGDHELTAAYYSSEMTDRIVWVAAGSFGVTPKNIRTVESSGTELTWLWRPLGDGLVLRMNYSAINSTKASQDYPGDPNINTSLVYIPSETANVSATLRVDPRIFMIRAVEGSLGYRYVGFRYTNEDNSGSLPAYHLTDAALMVHWSAGESTISTAIDVLNMFDTPYEVILGYPMPGRSYRLRFAFIY